MDLFKPCSVRLISNAPGRLYRALPAVVLGTLFNILDTVSTGLLLFPVEEGSGPSQFKSLQIQGLSMYIMSTVLSQVAMTLGGSRFPGALGAMLIEILPFLRGIGSDIRSALGSNNPAVVPTVMAAYTLTSFLTGFVFIILGLLKLGNLVAYFPQTVLTGAIGAIGLSLFILGLGLTLPESSPALTLHSIGAVLFSRSHLPLLIASFTPALLLSVSKRSKNIERWTWGAVNNAYYVPCYLASIPVVFWMTVASLHLSKETLISHGWLFRVDTSAHQSGIGTSWIYWREFDFPKVEWWALKHALTNIVLLVIIGVLNLPIYVPALAFSLDVSYDMNHEFLGQGVANILAGAAGTVPNILQYSYSVFVTRANGGRFKMALVTILTFILFLTSSLLLPYVPTILASALVLFLGIELLLEAVWESAKALVLLEWVIVITTLMSCTFLGFVEGFGVGIGTAAIVYLVYGVVDSRARAMQWEEWNETHRHQQQDEHATPMLISALNHTPSVAAPAEFDIHYNSNDVENAANPAGDNLLPKINARVVVLSGYVFFASIPSLENKLLDSGAETPFVVVDMTMVHRLETAAAQCFDRAVRDLTPRSTTLILCGIQKGSGVHADFERAGVILAFDTEHVTEKGILSFATRGDSLAWCRGRYDQVISNTKQGTIEKTDMMNNQQAYDTFCKVFDFDLQAVLRTSGNDADGLYASSTTSESIPVPDLEAFLLAGARFVSYNPRQVITKTGSDCFVFFIDGQAYIMTPVANASRPSLGHVLMMLPKESLSFMKRRLFSRRRTTDHVDTALPGYVFSDSQISQNGTRVLAQSRCTTVEIDRRLASVTLMSWACKKIGDKASMDAADGRAIS